MPTVSRITSTGTLFVKQGGSFDEITTSTVRVSTDTVFASEFDEVSLNAGSIQFNGSSQYLSVPSSVSALSGTTFTAECWIYLTGYSSLYAGGNYAAALLTTTDTSSLNGGNFGLQWTIRGTASSWTSIGMYANNGSINTSNAFNFSLNTWYHVALTHTAAGSWEFFVNGVSVGTASNATTWTDNTPYAIGRNNQSSYEYYFPGYISNFRLVSGSIVYSGNFTPSQIILDSTTATSLLLNVLTTDTFIKNNSSNQLTVTNVNTATFSTNGPFNQGNYAVKQRQLFNGKLEITGEFDEANAPFGDVTFNTVGTGTWTVPAGVTSVTVKLWGGGGGSGGAGYIEGGGGGGGGAYASKVLSVTPSQSISYTVGTGGAAGGYNGFGLTVGTSGGASTSSGVIAGGGLGGGDGIGGAGGTASGGDVNTTGQSGFGSFQGVNSYKGGLAGNSPNTVANSTVSPYNGLQPGGGQGGGIDFTGKGGDGRVSFEWGSTI